MSDACMLVRARQRKLAYQHQLVSSLNWHLTTAVITKFKTKGGAHLVDAGVRAPALLELVRRADRALEAGVRALRKVQRERR